jgi:hypothetical protein
MLLVRYLSTQSNLPARISAQLPHGRALQRSDVLQHYRCSRTDKLLLTPDGIVTLKMLKQPSEADGATGIFQADFTPEKEGDLYF